MSFESRNHEKEMKGTKKKPFFVEFVPLFAPFVIQRQCRSPGSMAQASFRCKFENGINNMGGKFFNLPPVVNLR